MKNWQIRKYDNKKNYYQFLKDIGYAEDPLYENKLKRIKLYDL